MGVTSSPAVTRKDDDMFWYWSLLSLGAFLFVAKQGASLTEGTLLAILILLFGILSQLYDKEG
jgi:hypothetical protein